MTDQPQPAAALREDLQVFELVECGSSSAGHTRGLFRTTAGAQAHAATIHQGYLDMQEATDPAERDDFETVTPTLTWALEQLYMLHGRVPNGPPDPVSHYSETSYFRIRTLQVGR